jgi:hypothetical protein
MLQQNIGGSESPESEAGGSLPQDQSQLAGFQSPNANVFQQGSQRLPPLPQTYEHARTPGGAPIAHIHRLSSDEQALDRLPSITSTGLLVERDRMAAMQSLGTSEPPSLRGTMSSSLSPPRDEPMIEAGPEPSEQYQAQR